MNTLTLSNTSREGEKSYNDILRIYFLFDITFIFHSKSKNNGYDMKGDPVIILDFFDQIFKNEYLYTIIIECKSIINDELVKKEKNKIINVDYDETLSVTLYSFYKNEHEVLSFLIELKFKDLVYHIISDKVESKCKFFEITDLVDKLYTNPTWQFLRVFEQK